MRAKTMTLTAVPTTGTPIDYGSLPRNLPITLLLYPGRTGGLNLQWGTGALTVEGGEYIFIPQLAGGDDPIALNYDSVDDAPTHISSTAATINVRYCAYRRGRQ